MTLTRTGSNRVWGGEHIQFEHESAVLGCTMRFAVFLPPQAESRPVPVLYFLAGLTCNDENFMQKAAAQQKAAELGIALVAPDTSPRGPDVPDDPEGAYDFGLGAGFYLNATQNPWRKHYQMYDYVVSELPELVEGELPVTDQRAISGHSMGGHGALVIALRNPGRYRSVSAFAPVTNPTQVPWGEKAFANYLGTDRDAWVRYDTCELIRGGAEPLPTLVDQGEADNFLSEQLRPDNLEAAAKGVGYPLTLRRQPGYDHSYYFIQTFIGDHLEFHSKHLQ